LLFGTLSDLSVHVPPFSRVYPLHRLFLVQSDFFRTLLSGGFSEESSTSDGRATLVLHLEPNITRSAFEFCLARLYGGGPEIVPPPWARSSQTCPLGLLFPVPRLGPLQRSNIITSAWSQLASPNVQPATPFFLISLLITAEYLGLESIAQFAVDKIQETLTPWTVPIYLRFAVGHGLVGLGSEERLAGCVGLEAVGSSTADEHPARPDSEQSHGNFYGPMAAKVGEACACWLVRWGADVLQFEEDRREVDKAAPLVSDPAVSALLQREPWLATPELKLWREGGLPANWVRGVISSDAFFLSPELPPPKLSLPPRESNTFIANVGISDGEGEWRRYAFAKRVVELRRSEKEATVPSKASSPSSSKTTERTREVSPDTENSDDSPKKADDEQNESSCGDDDAAIEDEDELEYERLFSEGIYYSHLVRFLLFCRQPVFSTLT
jgi:hypothetical protein